MNRHKGVITMHKQKRNRPYYVVIHGRKPGIYKNNNQALSQVHGFPYGKMKKIKGLQAAKAYFAENRQTDSANKSYYVVKRGRNPGLYLDKGKALEQIKKFPYGKVKRIKGYENAKAYFHGKDLQVKEKIPNIFVDGSYIQQESFSGYGFVVEENGKVIAKYSGTIADYDIINLHSLGAELYALIRAIEWAMTNEYKYVRIIYDSESVIQLLENNNIKNAKYEHGKRKLIQLYIKYKHFITIQFQHKNNKEAYRTYHETAHNLSRLMSNLLHDEYGS